MDDRWTSTPEGVKPVRLLIVEDDPAYGKVLMVRFSLMTEPIFQPVQVPSLKEAQSQLEKQPMDIILLDLSLTDSRGLDTFRRVSLQFPEIPVVVLSGFDDEAMALECVRNGAQDYLVKGQFEITTLARFLRFAMERHRQQIRFRALSITDDLTGIYNRRGFFELGNHQIKIAERAERELLLFFFDLDKFKRINDHFGHAEGDWVLIRMAVLLKETFRSSDVIARLGGDEFCVLALEASQTHIPLLISRFQEKMKSFNEQVKKPFKLSCSIGYTCFYPKQATLLENLLTKADHLLYENKKSKAVQNTGMAREI